MSQSSAGPVARRRARGQWIKGAKQLGFTKTFEEREEPDKVAALRSFGKAVELDPGMTDAWLGVHAAGGDKSEALARIVAGIDRFGEERDADKRRLSSTFGAGWWFHQPLETTDEVWHAEALRLIGEDRPGEAGRCAEQIIEELRHDFVTGCVAQQRKDLRAAMTAYRKVPAEGHLGAEAFLRLGIVLAQAEQWSDAETVLKQAAGLTINHLVQRDAEYFLGFVHRAMGREDMARRQFEWVYGQDPDHRQIAEVVMDPSIRLQTVALPDEPARPVVIKRAESSPPMLHRQPDWGAVQGILNELDRNVGMEDVKRQVAAVAAQVRAGLMRAERGLPTAKLGGHLVFAGPPGTGKTTVARVVAKLYRALGLLDGEGVVETDRSGLVANFIGQTATKTNEVIDRAMDGVLFIDEAYALKREGVSSNDFGVEAIDTLLKRMEDDRDRLIVIVAGYAEPMARFLEANPGLRSRFAVRIDFPRYTSDQLREIARRLAASRGDHLTPDALTGLTGVLDQICSNGRIDDLGNARFIRNALDAASKHRDLRLFNAPGTPTDLELVTLDGSDMKSAVQEILSF